MESGAVIAVFIYGLVFRHSPEGEFSRKNFSNNPEIQLLIEVS